MDSNSNSQSTPSKELNENSKSQQVHNPVHLLANYPELATIITAWPKLPEHIKAKIKALIETSKTE